MMLLLGDCLEQMKTLEANSVDAVVTDPPYGLAFMNKKWDYDVPSIDIWREVFRVLKPGGHVLSFGGTRTYHRMVVNIEGAGFEIRDQVQWIYGSGFPKSHNVSKAIDKMAGAEREVVGKSNRHGGGIVGNGTSYEINPEIPNITAPATPEAKQWDGWGSALKPANEPICLARKPLEKGLTLAENVLKYGTGAINVDGCRIGTGGDRVPGGLNSTKFNNETGSLNFRVNQTQRPTGGRWPANVLFDEDAAEMLDAQSGKLIPGVAKEPKQKEMNRSIYGKTKTLGRECGYADSGGASRFFYVAKASKRERNAGLEGMPTQTLATSTGQTRPNKPARLGADPQATQKPVQNFHPTVKPIKLMEYLITLITPPNGTALDPFMGSGSTGVACKNLNINFIGIEMNEEYFEIAQKRIEATK